MQNRWSRAYGPLLLVWSLLACAPRAARASATVATVASFATSDTFVARRHGRFVVVELTRPHRVLSTSTFHGGQSSQVTHLVNFQSMEARGNGPQFEQRLALGGEEYHRIIVESLGLSPAETALMGTAADMNHLVHRSREYRGLRVDVLATGGVRGNSLRAGDPSQWYQTGMSPRRAPSTSCS